MSPETANDDELLSLENSFDNVSDIDCIVDDCTESTMSGRFAPINDGGGYKFC